MLNLTTPTANTLETLDCALQSSNVSRQWEYSGVPDIYYQCTRDNKNGDWSDIFKNEHNDFMTAWHKTLAFISQYNLNIEELTKDWI